MSVGRICVRDVDTATGDESALVAARRMRDRGVGTLVVVDGDAKPVGVVSDRDITIRVVAAERDPGRTPVREMMSPMPTTILESSSIESALGQMRTGRFRRMPVVDRDGHLAGIVTLDDILALLAEEMSMVGGLLERESPRRGV